MVDLEENVTRVFESQFKCMWSAAENQGIVTVQVMFSNSLWKLYLNMSFSM